MLIWILKDFDEAVQIQKKRKLYLIKCHFKQIKIFSSLYFFFFIADFSVPLNSAANEKLQNIVTATERGDRWECHVVLVYPSLTFQNPEEGGKKPPKR